MNARIKGIVAAAALLAVAACSDASSLVAPDEASLARAGGSYAMTFAWTQDYDNNLAESPEWASGGAGVASFGGLLVTPTPCYDVAATNAVDARGVVVTVTATPTGAACIQVITDNHYTGQIAGMPVGTHRVRILHKLGSARPTEAYSGMVTVW